MVFKDPLVLFVELVDNKLVVVELVVGEPQRRGCRPRPVVLKGLEVDVNQRQVIDGR